MLSHRYAEPLQLTDKRYRSFVDKLFLLLWKEGLGSGDITSILGITKAQIGTASIIAKGSGIIAGLDEILFFVKAHSELKARTLVRDGQRVKKDNVILELSGKLREILGLERTILNVLGRLSGIATLTEKLVQQARPALLVPTRKTFWGPLDKKACLLGGGGTHRIRLDDAVLIKHTHLAASVSNWRQYINDAFNKKSSFVEIEVATAKQALEVAREIQKPFVMMLDNMSPQKAKSSIREIRKLNSHVLVEVSGGITANNLRAYAKTGADIISMGALTYGNGVLDVALRILPTKEM